MNISDLEKNCQFFFFLKFFPLTRTPSERENVKITALSENNIIIVTITVLLINASYPNQNSYLNASHK